MVMPATQWTLEMLHALPDDGNRYELIDGELFVTPSPTEEHQHASAELHLLLAPYAKAVGLVVLYAPFDIRFSQQREVQPDLVAWPLQHDRKAPSFLEPARLTLVVEILSPSTARVDRHRKRMVYQSHEVSEYWIVDAANRVIERWRPNDAEPGVFLESMLWQPMAGVEPLQIDVAAYFREVHGE